MKREGIDRNRPDRILTVMAIRRRSHKSKEIMGERKGARERKGSFARARKEILWSVVHVHVAARHVGDIIARKERGRRIGKWGEETDSQAPPINQTGRGVHQSAGTRGREHRREPSGLHGPNLAAGPGMGKSFLFLFSKI